MKTKTLAWMVPCAVVLLLLGAVAGFLARFTPLEAMYRDLADGSLTTAAVPAGGEPHAGERAERLAADHDLEDEHGDEDEHEDEHEGESRFLHLNRQAVENLGVRIGTIELGEYVEQLRIPGRVVEMPGRSDHALAAPVHGIVTKVHAMPGQAVQPSDALFDLRVTDESLIDAQLKLLETLTRMEVVAAESKRLDPLAESGTVPGRRSLELQYEQQQLESQKQVRLQELYLRGLDPEQVERIVADRKLVRDLTVRLPSAVGDTAGRGPATPPPAGVAEQAPPAADAEQARPASDAEQARPASDISPATASTGPEPSKAEPSQAESAPPVQAISRVDPDRGSIGRSYTIETLEAFPGKTVRQGDDLCHLAEHTSLYIQGQAFEDEVEAVARAADEGREVVAEFGVEGEELQRGDLRVHYIDNHVDPVTHTFLFYVPLTNEVLHEKVDERGRVFRSWRFKPGQRAHLRVTVARHEGQIKLPVAAVVEEGFEAFVFRVHEPTAEEAEEGVFLEFEQVPVGIQHRDPKWVVLNREGPLQVGDQVALDRAYQLYLALKRESGEGGGHHHHDH